MHTIKRWARVEEFNPLSPLQVLDYLKLKKYQIPKDRKTRKPTTGKEAIAKLSVKYPGDALLQQILTARHLNKAIGYLDDSRLGRDGKFHPTYTFAPDTGRLASINPNFQNQPKGGVDEELATAIRETIVPSPGMVLVELDWKAIEAVLTGYFAGDEGYARLSVADSHSFLAWHIRFSAGKGDVPPDPADPDLERLLGGFKKQFPKERELAKKVNHATSYGMGAKHLADNLRITKAEAIHILEIKDKASPKVAEWKAVVRRKAHFDGFLENPFGYRRYFSEVFRKDKYSGKWVLGEEANKCLAFLSQSTAAAMLRETLPKVQALPGHGTEWHMLVPIHDAILLEVPNGADDLQRVRDDVKQTMEVQWPQLGGLRIAVDVKTGRNWGEMK
jgi:DNA polymerase-1